jgi:O-antigen/teichoic acid export membrane protein
MHRAIGKLPISMISKVAQIFFIRGLGSALAVLLTLSVTRYLETSAAARFLLVFNLTTVAALCFRWGLDYLIARSVATASAENASDLIRRLMQLAHRRVVIWMVLSAAFAAVFGLVRSHGSTRLTVWELLIAVVISGLAALTACAGQVQRGLGRINYSAFILNMLVPGLMLSSLLLLTLFGFVANSWRLELIYASVALLSYFGTVWASPAARPYRSRQLNEAPNRSDQEKMQREAANRFGGIVLSQQALNWSALLIVPVAYGDQLFNSFMVTYKVALLLTLAMTAVNFTFLSRLAALYAAAELQQLRRLTRMMVVLVSVSCVLGAAVVFLARGVIYSFGDVEGLDVVLALLVVSQAFFAVSAVYSQVLNMCHDEAFVLGAHGTVVATGVILFVILSLNAPLEVASATFAVTYFSLMLLLRYRTLKITAGFADD